MRHLVRASIVVTGIAAGACSLLLDDGFTEGGSTPDATPEAAAPDASVDAADATTSDAPSFVLGCDAPDLVAGWTFDEKQGTTAADCTGHLFTAKLEVDAGWGPGRDGGGGSLSLDGMSFAEIDNATALRFPGPLTVMAWMQLRSTVENSRIIASSAPNAGDQGFELTFERGPRMDGRTSYLSFITNDGTMGHSVGTPPILPGTWVHVAGVHDGNRSSIYLNGVAAESAVVGTRRVASEPIYLGRRSDTGCCFLTGYIDDARIYGRALPPEEILALAKLR